jgi:formylglycine-generating enzyme required for sulfatase activity
VLPGYEYYPVTDVTWYGATEFATYVGGKLPTEAQWEYACRAGTTTPFSTGNFLTNLQANYNWEIPYNGGTNTVTTNQDKSVYGGTYEPNAFGVSDMHGNVSEWCSDWFHDSYGSFPTLAQINPTGPTTGEVRIYRGGSLADSADQLRSACRSAYYPSGYAYFIGFRVVFAP